MIFVLVPLVAIFSSVMVLTVVKLMPPNQNKVHSSSNPILIEYKQIQTFLKINNKCYSFSYDSDRVGMQHTAIEFCSHFGSNLGVTVKTFPNCVKTIVTGLIDSEHFNISGTSILTKANEAIVINGNLLNGSESNTSIVEIRNSLVVEQINEITNSTVSMLENSMPPLHNQVISPSQQLIQQEQLQQQQIMEIEGEAQKIEKTLPTTPTFTTNTITINLEINGLTYVFDFPSSKSAAASSSSSSSVNSTHDDTQMTAERLAHKFCTMHSVSLGLLSAEESLNESALRMNCAAPLTDALMDEYLIQTQAYA